MPPRVVSLNVSKGGVPKLPVEQVTIATAGVEGDRQRDRRLHGGPMRAVCLYSLELIEQLQLEGHPIVPGAIGENVTIGGIDWREVRPGAVLRLGQVVLEIRSYTIPCRTIRGAFLDEDFTRISQKLYPGWSRVYASVRTPGHVQVGDDVSITMHPPVQQNLF